MLAFSRARVFEMMLPFRLAANIKRFQSPYLMGQYAQVVTMERDLVLRLLPDGVRADRYRVEALCATLSFQNWRAIRHVAQTEHNVFTTRGLLKEAMHGEFGKGGGYFASGNENDGHRVLLISLSTGNSQRRHCNRRFLETLRLNYRG